MVSVVSAASTEEATVSAAALALSEVPLPAKASETGSPAVVMAEDAVPSAVAIVVEAGHWEASTTVWVAVAAAERED